MIGNMKFGIQLDSVKAAKANAEEIYSPELGTRLGTPYLGCLQCKGVLASLRKIDLLGEGSVSRRPRGYPNFPVRLSPYFRAP